MEMEFINNNENKELVTVTKKEWSNFCNTKDLPCGY